MEELKSFGKSVSGGFSSVTNAFRLAVDSSGESARLSIVDRPTAPFLFSAQSSAGPQWLALLWSIPLLTAPSSAGPKWLA